MSEVIILRGLPGSGKSTWAKINYPKAPICSADNWFVKEGKYKFNPKEIGMAHEACMEEFLMQTLLSGIDPPTVIVDNTNIELWELSPYLSVAKACGHSVRIVRFETPIDICITRNIHGVPASTIRSMKNRFQEVLPYWEETVIKG